MFRALRYLLILAFAGAILLAGFATFGDLAPKRQETREPVTLNGD